MVIIDDILATGGTMNASIKLIRQEGGIVEQVMLLGLLGELKGV